MARGIRPPQFSPPPPSSFTQAAASEHKWLKYANLFEDDSKDILTWMAMCVDGSTEHSPTDAIHRGLGFEWFGSEAEKQRSLAKTH